MSAALDDPPSIPGQDWSDPEPAARAPHRTGPAGANDWRAEWGL